MASVWAVVAVLSGPCNLLCTHIGYFGKLCVECEGLKSAFSAVFVGYFKDFVDIVAVGASVFLCGGEKLLVPMP